MSTSKCRNNAVPYTWLMPRLWTETIETHRREVRDAILDATVALVAKQGLRSVTMSQIAEMAGIGRATLYKYYPDVERILSAWHDRQITGHLEHLSTVRDQGRDPTRRLEAVLVAYATISLDSHAHLDTELMALLHRDERVTRARHQLHTMLRDLLNEGVKAGHFRDDVPPGELASYCMHAIAAARNLPSRAAVRRLVKVTLDGLQQGA